MYFKNIELHNFRNFDDARFEFCESVNLIHGENGKGKTNLIEGLWVCSGIRSFRGSRDSELVRFGCDGARLRAEFFRTWYQTLDVLIEDKRKYTLEGVGVIPQMVEETGPLAVVFSPSNLTVVQGGPDQRRRFLDMAISQLRPAYANDLSKYNRAVFQRNSLLKDMQKHPELRSMAETFEYTAAHYAARIAEYRRSYITKLNEIAGETYKDISGGKEKMTLAYNQGEGIYMVTVDDYRDALLRSRKRDIFTGTTSVGVHRDDFDINLDLRPARKFGSQGQQRSCALSLKLAQADIISDEVEEKCIILLDDVMSELDEKRQDFILNRIDNRQVIITCCDPETVRMKGKGIKIKLE